MNVHQIVKRTEKLITDNSPAILTAIGVTGTITTAYLTGQATFKAAELIQYNENLDVHVKPGIMTEKIKELDRKEKFNLVWKLYIPAAGTGLLTIGCIVGANRIGTRRAAAMAAAYSISEKAWGEYKDKVVEKFGETKEQKVRDEVAQDQVTRNAANNREVIVAGSGEVLCYDSISGRFFQSSMEDIRKAQNDINYEINNNMCASLYEFWGFLGLTPTPWSTEVGWNADHQLEVMFSSVIAEDGRPCLSLNYATFPFREYGSLH